MKGQWGLITGLIIVLVISIFAVINVDPVEVNYLFGQSDWPLVLVIIGSVLMGGLIVGSVGMYKIYRLQQQVKQLRNQIPEVSDSDEELVHDDDYPDQQIRTTRKARKKG
ncbi:hypothetical protein CR194_00990 [Salipaludibacillus keqinensis]|jgi:lipopolysaccharide assembly protein A|uniref:Lipopolysaccharide assembly protein A domain-containing protein n=1 Tax=Salipaludibacillus keqinensis TaxID=2045207 RepID=A0A323TKF6_9BACI|nr:lipopolysaccharide assembly LapA domain-containing protein [Salipaludibacillus keqinensis]PYZ94147.1 hypothetical protein CR194_00990 [Salipaludibacillus keqinensis]